MNFFRRINNMKGKKILLLTTPKTKCLSFINEDIQKKSKNSKLF